MNWLSYNIIDFLVQNNYVNYLYLTPKPFKPATCKVYIETPVLVLGWLLDFRLSATLGKKKKKKKNPYRGEISTCPFSEIKMSPCARKPTNSVPPGPTQTGLHNHRR